ncbi:MAG: histidinol dehydrogenase [Buchnera aphidicola (Pentalonia nigronervosa)]|jgi:histidinol dehydrogenase|uniref:Histidinol dehydrogenase n=1 Tax=Buchnera aphidicola (Pentalonia nigronervosa) TaxID=1309793 RepID=A0A7H1AZD6_9GAMM|nr:MAG: histidinol dehydrogenase [Buchnera aphidicola (Pentalonia nigronervosa)]
MKYFDNVVFWNDINIDEKNKILARPFIKKNKKIKKIVKEIIENVKKNGDQALRQYTKLFEKFIVKEFEIPRKKIILSSESINSELKNAILSAKKNITCFHKAQLLNEINLEIETGVRCQQIYLPLNTIGIYIPNGTAPLFSTVLMLAIPAKIAGCKNIVLCSPPPVSDEILYTAHICGVDKIFQIGGAQAIASLACGTKTIPKVDKIFGPGNAYVTESKLQVSSMFNGPEIDMLAGPSELLIIADDSANPDFIAADLLSQAEHDSSSQVILVTPCIQLAQKVIVSLNKQLLKLFRLSEILNSLSNSAIIIAKDLRQCIDISNIYSPEHLMIQTIKPRDILDSILNASSIFLGLWSPESAGDYASGTNHVLPTYGKSISVSALGIADFQKRVLVQELTPQGLIKLSNTIQVLSSSEKLEAHKNAVRIRVDFLEKIK